MNLYNDWKVSGKEFNASLCASVEFKPFSAISLHFF